MTVKQLITQSKAHYESLPKQIENKFSLNIFNNGARWMFDKLTVIDSKRNSSFNSSLNFNFYGYLKYGFCLTIWFISVLLFLQLNIYFTPISIIVFYFCEVHFLFLFPLLIDNVKNPILTSITQTYRIGLLVTIFTVCQIGLFMLVGLINFKNPYKNWHIGCIAILIWYKNEVRNRI